MFLNWLISILKFFIAGRRFLLISPPFFKRQFWYDRNKKIFFSTYNRDRTDWYTSWQVFLEDQYSTYFLNNSVCESNSKHKEINIHYQEILRNGCTPLIIDCGSNSGASSIYFGLTFPQSKIIALEIDKDNYLHSLENIKLSNIKVESNHKGISSIDGFGDFIDPGLGNNAYRIEVKDDPKNSVELLSINTILQGLGPEKNIIPFIVKIDIEGGEDDLFSKNIEWIKEFPLMIVELHDWLMPKKKTSINFLKAISNHDRDFVYRGENIFSISNKIRGIQS
jgi:FkbM family methyltransferase